MNRIEFMTELASLLQDIPAEERRDAMQYYNDYFDDAGEDQEQQVIDELESPQKVAEKIKADMTGEAERQSGQQDHPDRCDRSVRAACHPSGSTGDSRRGLRSRAGGLWILFGSGTCSGLHSYCRDRADHCRHLVHRAGTCHRPCADRQRADRVGSGSARAGRIDQIMCDGISGDLERDCVDLPEAL